ncbi:hypothetical protein, partial [Celeribacter sp.]|uniref:hypothetical protein n=1 Tax=Celeribacter sp. TaxID=1890673 RepID=UPI003A8D059E
RSSPSQREIQRKTLIINGRKTGFQSILKEQTNAKEPFYRGADNRDDQDHQGKEASRAAIKVT